MLFICYRYQINKILYLLYARHATISFTITTYMLSHFQKTTYTCLMPLHHIFLSTLQHFFLLTWSNKNALNDGSDRLSIFEVLELNTLAIIVDSVIIQNIWSSMKNWQTMAKVISYDYVLRCSYLTFYLLGHGSFIKPSESTAWKCHVRHFFEIQSKSIQFKPAKI